MTFGVIDIVPDELVPVLRDALNKYLEINPTRIPSLINFKWFLAQRHDGEKTLLATGCRDQTGLSLLRHQFVEWISFTVVKY